MSSYSEWLGRKMQNERKFLDTRPHRDAGHHTEVVKRLAVATLGRRPTGKPVVEASTYTDFVGGADVRAATRANTKAPQITMTCTSVLGETSRYPSPNYTNPAVLKGLGRAKLANCCVTCGVTADTSSACKCVARATVTATVTAPQFVLGNFVHSVWIQSTTGSVNIQNQSTFGTLQANASYPNVSPYANANAADGDIILNNNSQTGYDNIMMYFDPYFLAPQTGTIVFSTNVDDSAQILFNNVLVYRNFGVAGTVTNSVPVVAGQYYPMKLLYRNGGGGINFNVKFTLGTLSNIPLTNYLYSPV